MRIEGTIENMAGIEHCDSLDDRLRDEEVTHTTRKTLTRTRKELTVMVSCSLGVALTILWLLLT